MTFRVAFVTMVVAASACASKLPVQTAPGGPALEPPSPPARVIVPAPEKPTLPVADEPPVSPPSTASGSRAPAQPPRPTPAAPPPATPEATPPPLLMSTANAAEFEKRIRAQMSRAETDLGQINRQALGADARAQFDAARGFLRQADDALKVRNLVFAGQLADKAATLATMLKR